jgi:hypothetical protein
MDRETHRLLSQTQFGKYLINASVENDPELSEALRQARDQAIQEERERVAAIERTGGENALEASNLLSKAMLAKREAKSTSPEAVNALEQAIAKAKAR